ncbi:MAG: hypothetical protein ACRDN0_37075 [Trebonia sp.]
MEHVHDGGLAELALAVLRWNWGRAYEIDCDPGLWRARRRDGLGEDITAREPDDLRDAILRDYDVNPVPRGERA